MFSFVTTKPKTQPFNWHLWSELESVDKISQDTTSLQNAPKEMF